MSVRIVWVATCFTLGLVLAAGNARAIPVFFNGPSGFGISAESAADALAAGVPIIEVDSISQAVTLGLTIPEPDVMSSTLVSNPSVSNPNRATSEWSVTRNGATGLSDAWLVFLTPIDDFYVDSNVGFEIAGNDDWAVIQVFVPQGEGGSDYYYPAKFLGDMTPGEAVDFLMRHRVGQALRQGQGELILPQYSVGALQNVPLPEPATLVLAVLGLALTAALRSRSV